MGGEGHMADMITRMKNNRAIKDQKKQQQRKVNDLYRNHHHSENSEPIHDVEISEEKLEKIKISIRRRKYREHRISMFFSLVVTIIIVSAIVIAIFWGFID